MEVFVNTNESNQINGKFQKDLECGFIEHGRQRLCQYMEVECVWGWGAALPQEGKTLFHVLP